MTDVTHAYQKIKELKLMKCIIITLLLILGLNQIVGLIFLVHGTFEMFPTAEQEDKIRTVGLMMLLLPILFEIFLVRQMLKRDRTRLTKD